MHAFDVLGDPVRRRILELLADGEVSSGAVTTVIQEEFGISQPAVSQHLKVLRDSGFATVRPEGTRRLYAVDAEPFRELDDWLEHFRGFLEPAPRFAGYRARPWEARTPPERRHVIPERRRHDMIDIVKEIEASRREVTDGRIAAGPGRSVRLSREYDASVDELWDAVTNPERIGRWFLPISGDYRIGGRYQFEGNAGGEIVVCEKPTRLKVTWVYGEPATEADISEVEVRLSAVDGERTRFELIHTAIVPEDRWDEYGPGAVGVGWEQGLLGLTLHLRGTRDSIGDPVAWQLSAEGRDFARRSSVGWGEANVAAGADPEAAARAVANTTAFYAPDPAVMG